MKRALVFLSLMLGAVSLGAAFDYCLDCPYYPRAAGPEITGNYALPYLYSPEAQRAYADPAYYTAQIALRRWRSRDGGARIRNTYMPAPAPMAPLPPAPVSLRRQALEK